MLCLINQERKFVLKKREPFSHIMIKNVYTIKEYNSLPVVDDGELKGIVPKTDVIAYMLEQY